jgi:hypothetical protein
MPSVRESSMNADTTALSVADSYLTHSGNDIGSRMEEASKYCSA